MADGFLGRWSRRKQEVREGVPQEEPPRVQAAELVPEVPTALPSGTAVAPVQNAAAPATKREPLPTMADVQALTNESDFKPFVARNVDPEVRNAAMKKLFADPHYNVMDRLDIYIDDYSQPDPLPESMLRQMASAKFLNLFDDDEKSGPAHPSARDNATLPATPVAQAANPSQYPPDLPADARPATEPVPQATPQITTEDHAHTDLRLQQDHAAGASGPGRGVE
jgi:hypothetical protein